MPRRTSFIGTVNEVKFLRDQTGNRRFLPIVVTGKLIIPDSFNVDGLWAYVCYLYTLGEQWWLTPEEEQLQRKALAKHLHNPLMDTLLDNFDFNSSERNVQMTGTEILKKINEAKTSSNFKYLGNALTEIGIKRDKDKRVYFMPDTSSVMRAFENHR